MSNTRFNCYSGTIAFLLMALPSYGQGFINLNFESGTVVPVVIDGVTYAQFGPAFPGWTGYFDSSVVTYANYNNPNLGRTGIGLLDQNSPVFGTISNFTAELQGGTAVNDFDVSLAQTGLVPMGTLSLRFVAFNSRNNFFVSMNGQPLTLSILQDWGTFKEYGADISSFAGQMTELRFTKGHGLAQFGDLFLDEISFSPVPEPSTWALFALGSALCWCAARRRRK